MGAMGGTGKAIAPMERSYVAADTWNLLEPKLKQTIKLR